MPAPTERAGYVSLWNASLESEVRLSEMGQAQVVAATEGFSFTYLKELFLSLMMRWGNAPEPGGMDTVMVGQCQILREQRNSAALTPPADPAKPAAPEEDEDEYEED